jgi:Peptidase inhibitor family I36
MSKLGRHRVAGLLASLAIAAGGLLLAPAPATAGTGACTSTYLCVWDGINYDGARGQFAGTNSYWGTYGWNDRASSARNNGTSGAGVYLYKDSNYGGAALCVPRGYRVSNLGSYGFSNNISSNLWSYNCHS